MLRGRVALVTGGSRGIGRGIALQLGQAGAIVYITGRQPNKSDASNNSSLPALQKTAEEVTERGGQGIAVYCDHSNDEDVKRLFDRIGREQNGQLDILINNAYGGVNTIIDNLGKPFWETPVTIWDDINNVGLRNHYICAVYAAKMMVPRNSGLIVIVSSPGGLKYLFNVAYGIGKAACDRLAADTAFELKKHNITVVSLWPGPVNTELITSRAEALDAFKSTFVDEAESIEYSGLAVAKLAADKNRLQKTGRILLTADLGDEYGFKDIDGKSPPNCRSVKMLLKLAKWHKTADYMPAWIKLPGWIVTASASKM